MQTASAAATDRVGISLLKGIGALDCHNNWLDNIRSVLGFCHNALRWEDLSYFILHESSSAMDAFPEATESMPHLIKLTS